MKALVFEKYGGPEVLEWKDVPDPEPGPNDAVVEVKASAVNYNDIWGRRGAPQCPCWQPHGAPSTASPLSPWPWPPAPQPL